MLLSLLSSLSHAIILSLSVAVSLSLSRLLAVSSSLSLTRCRICRCLLSSLRRHSTLGQFFSASVTGDISLWDTRAGGRIHAPVCALLRGHNRAVTCITQNTAPQQGSSWDVVTGAADGRVLLWDLRNPTETVMRVTADVRPVMSCGCVATESGSVVMIATSKVRGTEREIEQREIDRKRG